MKVYHGSLLKLLEESRNSMFQIDQNNVHLLLPGKISWLVEYLHDDYGYSLKEGAPPLSPKSPFPAGDRGLKAWPAGPVLENMLSPLKGLLVIV